MSLDGGSFVSTCDADKPALKAAIDNLRATVIAADNDGFSAAIGSPASISSAIPVGNTTDEDLVAQPSNHSSLFKLTASGTDIEAAVPTKRYEEKTGPSMAATHVTGAFALMPGAKGQGQPAERDQGRQQRLVARPFPERQAREPGR